MQVRVSTNFGEMKGMCEFLVSLHIAWILHLQNFSLSQKKVFYSMHFSKTYEMHAHRDACASQRSTERVTSK